MNRRTLSVASGVARRGVRIFFTNPAMIVPATAFPIFFIAAFAGGLAKVENVPGFDFNGNYTSFIYVFVLLQAVALAGVFTGFGIARDFESGFGRRLLLAAPKRIGILFGYILQAMVRGVYSAAVVTVAALIGGLDVSGSGVDLFGLALLAVILNVAFGLWGTGVALRLQTIQAGPLIQIPVFLALFLAPVYVPRDLLQGWIRALSSVNPVSYVIEAGRDLISGSPGPLGLAFGLSLALVAVFAVWAITGLRSAERRG